jgi:hypothetical protein
MASWIANNPDVTIDVVTGSGIRLWKNELARARMQLFAGPPYFYYGNQDYENNYLDPYINSESSLLVRCSIGAQTAGMLTGMPISQDVSILQGLQRDPESLRHCFYFGEYLVMPSYRRLGIARAMHWTALVFAQIRGFHQFAILTIIPEGTSQPKAKRATPTSRCLWHELGYTKTGETCAFDWPTLGQDKSDAVAVSRSHAMELWLTNPVTDPAHPHGHR